MLKKLKIALLIIILAEEIRSARNYKKAIEKNLFTLKNEMTASD
ncbi:hypothetical protein [Staphylococcus haemolyticus]|nr:hypothetical protein [Staphylococcus haemolyticus]MEB2655222.1 hypothetical protein [Staphylococcus haemolyticus]